jgi:hypothetical protein
MYLVKVRERAAGSAGVGARGGEDAQRWCATVGDEECGRDKGGCEARRAGLQELILFFIRAAHAAVSGVRRPDFRTS